MFVKEEGEGLSNSVTYVDYVEVLAYARLTYGYEWFHRDTECVYTRDEVSRAAVAATQLVDSLPWNGCRSRKMQALEWPRCGVYSECNLGYCVPSHIIPKEIKDATIILTLGILRGSVKTLGSNMVDAKVKSVKMDKFSIDFAEGAYLDSTGGGACGGGLMTTSGDNFSSVRHLIKCYMGKTKPNAKFVRHL